MLTHERLIPLEHGECTVGALRPQCTFSSHVSGSVAFWRHLRNSKSPGRGGMAGTPRAELTIAVQRTVTTMRRMLATETSIEKKYARVALPKKKHFIGPARVSLANRLALFETWDRRGVIKVDECLTTLSMVRPLRSVPDRLGLSRHPLLADPKQSFDACGAQPGRLPVRP